MLKVSETFQILIFCCELPEKSVELPSELIPNLMVLVDVAWSLMTKILLMVRLDVTKRGNYFQTLLKSKRKRDLLSNTARTLV